MTAEEMERKWNDNQSDKRTDKGSDQAAEKCERTPETEAVCSRGDKACNRSGILRKAAEGICVRN